MPALRWSRGSVTAPHHGEIGIVVARNYFLALVFITPLALTIAIALLVMLVSEWIINRNVDSRGTL